MIIQCTICHNHFTRYVSKNLPVPKFCSNKCKGQWYSANLKGENNPNFGKKWSIKQRELQSKLMKSKITDEWRQKVGSGNRGKKFSAERIKANHGHRLPSSYSHPHSNESKQRIAHASKMKFETPGYKEKMRKKMEENGFCIPLEDKADWDIYKIEYHFNGPLHYFINTLEEQESLHQLGLFNAATNPKGLVRDHIFSRKNGFENGIFCEIIRHPANCQIITHSENVSKKNKSIITIDNLFEKIKSFNRDWHEHSAALMLIDRYLNGERWSR